jgi:hypothetical protein
MCVLSSESCEPNLGLRAARSSGMGDHSITGDRERPCDAARGPAGRSDVVGLEIGGPGGRARALPARALVRTRGRRDQACAPSALRARHGDGR